MQGEANEMLRCGEEEKMKESESVGCRGCLVAMRLSLAVMGLALGMVVVSRLGVWRRGSGRGRVVAVVVLSIVGRFVSRSRLKGEENRWVVLEEGKGREGVVKGKERGKADQGSVKLSSRPGPSLRRFGPARLGLTWYQPPPPSSPPPSLPLPCIIGLAPLISAVAMLEMLWLLSPRPRGAGGAIALRFSVDRPASVSSRTAPAPAPPEAAAAAGEYGEETLSLLW
jgi:hypothetical protein